MIWDLFSNGIQLVKNGLQVGFLEKFRALKMPASHSSVSKGLDYTLLSPPPADALCASHFSLVGGWVRRRCVLALRSN